MNKDIRNFLIYTMMVLVLSVAYFIYAYTVYPPIPEKETFITEIGEAFGEVSLWALLFIYARTLLKLMMGKGKLANRLLPDYSPPKLSILQQLLGILNKTHVHIGVATVAVIVLHITMMGVPMDILFFPAVLALVIWQGLFGLFITWRYTPKQLKKFSYLVHAQFLTGIMIGLFSYLGHLLIDK